MRVVQKVSSILVQSNGELGQAHCSCTVYASICIETKIVPVCGLSVIVFYE